MATNSNSIFNSDSDYQEFAQLFETKMDDHNSRVITPSTTNNTTDKLVEAYNDIMTNLNTLVDNYSSSLKNKQYEVADTFIQTLNYSIYQLLLNKDYEQFDGLLKYLKDMMGENSPIMLLLAELERLLMLYVNITKETCSNASDKAKFDTIASLQDFYSEQKYNTDNIRAEISSVLTEFVDGIVAYNQLIDEYNDSEKNTTKIENMYTVTMGDIDRYAKAYHMLTATPTTTYDSTEKYYLKDSITQDYEQVAISQASDFITGNTYYNLSSDTLTYYDTDGILQTRTPAANALFYSYRKSKYSYQKDYVNEVMTFYNSDSNPVKFSSKYYKISSITEHDSNNESYVATNTYYTYDVESNTYTLAVFEGDNPSFAEDTIYYEITWAEVNFTSAITSWNVFSTQYNSTDAFYVKTTGDYGTIYTYEMGGWQFFHAYFLLSGAVTNYNYSVDKYRLAQSKLGLYKSQIQNIHIEEKDSLKAQIHNVISELMSLLLLDANQLSLLPDGFELDEPDDTGHCDITAQVKDSTGTVMKSAKSFYVKKFKGNRFYAYMGEVNKRGFVGQKAQIYGYIPVKQESTERLNKTFLFSSPLLDINALNFKNNPKNIIFGLFNLYDYTATISIENDGEGKNKKNKNAYISDRSQIRFGSILSGTDIDINATKQSFRIRTDSNAMWSYGNIYKKGFFEICDVSITAKFDDELVGEYIKYSYPQYFSDSVSITMKIKDLNTGTTYNYTSTDDLSIDTDYTAQENEKAVHSTSSYYKGTMKIEPADSTDATNTSTVNYAANKDVVLRLTPVSNKAYEISLYLDPDSTTNANYYEDSGNDPTVYLPMIASNFIIPVANVSAAIRLELSEKLDSLSALLDICNLLNDDFEPFDELMYSNLVDRFKNAKDNMLKELLYILVDMANIITGMSTIQGIYSAYDSLYCKTYLEELFTTYATIQSSLQTYTSSSSADVQALYDGSFSEELSANLSKATTQITEIINDAMESENILHEYDNRLCGVMKYNKNHITFATTLAILYDIVTGSSQTISTMNSAGQPVKTFHMNNNYPDWINNYTTLPIADTGRSQDYFMETSTLQYIYAITQLLDKIKDNTTNRKYNPSYDDVKVFLKSLLLRLLKENITNPYYAKDLFQEDVVRIMKNYIDASKKIECSFLSFNKYYLNPYITSLFHQLEPFNSYNLDDLIITDFNGENSVVERMGKALIYKAILETDPKFINDKLTKLYKFLTNGQKLNVREVIFMYSFVSVLNELKDAVDHRLDVDGRPTINSIYSINVEPFNLTKEIGAILEYRTLINTETNNPIRELMQVDFDSTINTVPQLFDNSLTTMGTVDTNIYTGTSDEV